MEKLALNSIITSMIFLFISCGGVIGNIEKYEFTTSQDSLKMALNNVYVKYPSLMKNNAAMYGKNDEENFYYVANEKHDTTVFECCVITYESRNSVDLCLTSAVTWGKTMKLAPTMGFWEKRKYRRLFEREILPKIKEQIK
jgi:hypothetical protein